MNQKGFATLEIILMVMVVGILASIAIPRFNDVTTKANTAKIQADLATLDSAASIYQLETGQDATALSNLAPYVNDLPDPPQTGSAYVKGTATEISKISGITSTDGKYKYEVKKDSTTNVTRVYLGNFVGGDFYK